MQIFVTNRAGPEKVVPPNIHNDETIINKSAAVSSRRQSMSVNIKSRFRNEIRLIFFLHLTRVT